MDTQLHCSLNHGIEPVRGSPFLRMVLLNVQSLLNKTFILHDYFASHNLDNLFLTENWTKDGDQTPFTDLVPPNCTFISTPRMSGHRWGLVAVFKYNFHGRIIPFVSFELQMFQMEMAVDPVLFVIIYRPRQ